MPRETSVRRAGDVERGNGCDVALTVFWMMDPCWSCGTATTCNFNPFAFCR